MAQAAHLSPHSPALAPVAAKPATETLGHLIPAALSFGAARENISSSLEVLLVVPNGTARGNVEALLKSRFALQVASGVDEALELNKATRFALAVIDLPGASQSHGEVLASLRRIDPSLSVIFLSAGNTSKPFGSQCLKVPFDSPELLSLAEEQAASTLRRRGWGSIIEDMEDLVSSLQDELQSKRSLANYGESSVAMVHDLRNALFLTMGYTSRLVHEVEQLKPVIPDKIEGLATTARKLEQTSNYLFHLAQTCRFHGDEPAQEDIDLTEEVQHVHRVLFFNSPNIVMQSDGPLRVHGNRFELHRVLQNLFKNAFEANATKIEVRISPAGDGVLLEISDDGKGFQPEDARSAFERPLASSKRGGQGIGLRTCREIIERHQGTIQLASKPSLGSTFSIRLPTLSC
jgi:signal transduction histidine kinase